MGLRLANRALVMFKAAYLPYFIAYYIFAYLGAFFKLYSLNLTITESVSPYITSEPGYIYSTDDLVLSIISLPKQVTDEDIYREGNCPTVAPVNP